MEEIKINKIYRSSRRSLSLEITPQAELVVRAPFLVSEKRILNFVRSKSAWILQKKSLAQKKLEKIKPRNFNEGEELVFLNLKYLLKLVDSREIGLKGSNLEFPRRYLKAPEKYLEAWYREQARAIIVKRCEYFAKLMGLNYESIKIGGAQKRLGSCSFTNSLNFSWRLILAPPSAVDYVVIHELCHILEKNHGPRFWDKVERYFPNYRETRTWLRKNFQK